MSPQPVEYRVIFMCLLMRKGAKGGLDRDGGGGVRYLWIYFICLGQDINWDIVLSPAPVAILILFIFILFYFVLFYFILFYLYLSYFVSFHFILFYFILFYFILFYFILFYFILFYFILFYFILFYFILFYFTYLFYANKLEDSLFRDGPLEK